MNIHKYFSIKAMSRQLFGLTQKTNASKTRKPRIVASGVLSIAISCVGLFGLSIAQAQTCPANSYPATFSWSSSPGTGNEWLTSNDTHGVSQTYTVNYTGSGGNPGTLDVTITMQDPNGRNYDDNFVCPTEVTSSGGACDFTTFTETNGSFGTGFLTWAMASGTSAETMGLDFSFSKPVSLDDVFISDIDDVGYGYQPAVEPEDSFQDVFSFTASNGGTNVPMTLSGGSNINITGQTAQAIVVVGVNGNVLPTDAAGTLNISSSNVFDAFSMTYSNGPVDAANEPTTNGVSNGHAIRVSGFDLCVQEIPDLSINKTSSANGGPVLPGDTITYTIDVTNNSTATGAASDVVLSDVLPAGVTYVPGSAQKTYPAGGSGTFTHDMGSNTFDTGGLTQSYTVTSADVPSGATLTSYGFTTTGSSSDWLSDITLSATYPGGTAYSLGLGSFGGNGPGSWNVSRGPGSFGGAAEGLYRFIWDDDFNGVGGDDNSISTAQFTINYTTPRVPTTDAAGAPPNLVTATDGIDLLPGESMTVTFQVLVDDPLNPSIDQLINTASATSAEISTPVTDTAVDLVARLSIDKPAPTNADEDGSGDVSVGDTLTYTITATNDGGATLTNVVVSDPLITPTGGTSPCASVAAGGTCTLIGTYVVTAADVTAGQIDNTATADSDQTGPVTDTNTIPVPTPGMSIVKSNTISDPDGSGDVSVGDVVTYTYTVTNTGSATLTGVTVTDDLLGAAVLSDVGADGVGVLAPAAVETATLTYTIQASDLGTSIVNIATADSTQTPTTTDTNTVTVPAPSLSVDKVLTGNADEDGSGDVSEGDTLTYTITATNDGTSALTNVVVSDDLTGDFTGDGTHAVCSSPLASGATCVLVVNYVVTQADVDAGQILNTGTADSTQTPPVDDPEIVPVPQSPLLAVDKVLTGNADEDGSGDVSLGDTLTYTITATNTGNQTLNNVTVSDDLTGDSTACATLAPGATCVLVVNYVVTQADVDAGQITNTGTADSDETPPVDDPEIVPVPQSPLLAVDKVLTGNADEDGSGDVSLGDTLTYTITATNTGNQTLNNVTVSDDLTGDSTACATLAPGATCVLVVNYVVTQADVDAGQITNTGTADSDETPPVDDPEIVPVPQSPLLAVDKVLTGNADEDGSGDVSLGDTLTYTITATNTGNQTLNNVTVSDDLTGDSTACATLAPGARGCVFRCIR